MALTRPQQEQTLGVLLDTIKTEPTSWADIMAAVTAADIPVKNWLDVRRVLQFVMNKGWVVRLPDTSRELYVRVGGAK